MGRTTAQKAEKVIDAIDQMKVDGNDKEAQNLAADLNTNVSKAHRKVVKPKQASVAMGVPEHLDETFESNISFRGLAQRIGMLRADIIELGSQAGGERIPLSQIRVDLNNVSAALQASAPHAVCPYCKGTACEQCDALGWMHKDKYAGIPDERR